MNEFYRARRLKILELMKREKTQHPNKDYLSIYKQICSYPVLSIVAPVVDSYQDKIEFPGDPMCLYTALAYPIKQVVDHIDKVSKKFDQFPKKRIGFYNDLFPQWFQLPSNGYRDFASKEQSSKYDYKDGDFFNTDQLVFDPRAWTPDTKDCLKELLNFIDPKIVLISGVSSAQKFVVEIAKIVKEYNDKIIIILGGRHADETIKEKNGKIVFEHASVVSAIVEKRILPVIDIVLSGEGYYALDFLMKTISQNMDIEKKIVLDSKILLESLTKKRHLLAKILGKAIIISLIGGRTRCFVTSGEKTRLEALPLPYYPFVIRARFSVFSGKENKPPITAHINTAHTCLYSCLYCSEGKNVINRNVYASEKRYFKKTIKNYLDYGASAFFFDDSVLCGGNTARIGTLLEALSELREEAKKKLKTFSYSNSCLEKVYRTANFEWGAQLTFDSITTILSKEEARNILKRMNETGCTYLYFGIESLAEKVIKNVHKNLPNKDVNWLENTIKALELVKEANIRAGASVLFGLSGETMQTIDFTINEVAKLVRKNLLLIVSPNILSYHPGTLITEMDSVKEKIDYFNQIEDIHPPYSYFEEAFKCLVSVRLTEEMIWHIHNQTKLKWKKHRNMNLMKIPRLPMEITKKRLVNFYSTIGNRLVEQKNYPPEINEFLKLEKKLFKELVKKENCKIVVEVGCMDTGFILQETVEAGLSYIGIDVVKELVEELNAIISNSAFDKGTNTAIAYNLGVEELSKIIEKNELNAGEALVVFPFNSFGNIPDPEKAVNETCKLGLSMAIFTYKTDPQTTKIREKYYFNCNYKNTKELKEHRGILFQSEDGLMSYAYKESYIKKLLSKRGYEYKLIKFGAIGALYFCKKGGC